MFSNLNMFLFAQDFGAVFFDNGVNISIPLQSVHVNNHNSLREQLKSYIMSGGGTSMYRALLTTMNSLQSNDTGSVESSWIVCLTDGCSDDVEFNEFHINFCYNINLTFFFVSLCISH